ncbi:unnamed protein product [Brachionus calyciflorus]|uniref:Uncharacterized protein n=1 Tax=Brachionus calyciflorus TaxID=104777 RepID=A0A813M3S7_9BILA|nr:unnamed protein product [Brachionus calyciflorus]
MMSEALEIVLRNKNELYDSMSQLLLDQQDQINQLDIQSSSSASTSSSDEQPVENDTEVIRGRERGRGRGRGRGRSECLISQDWNVTKSKLESYRLLH